jgi:hypothetical protein
MGEPWQTNVQTKARTIERDLMPAVKLILFSPAIFFGNSSLRRLELEKEVLVMRREKQKRDEHQAHPAS